MKKGEFISPFFFVHTKLLEQPLGLCYAIGVLKKSERDCWVFATQKKQPPRKLSGKRTVH